MAKIPKHICNKDRIVQSTDTSMDEQHIFEVVTTYCTVCGQPQDYRCDKVV